MDNIDVKSNEITLIDIFGFIVSKLKWIISIGLIVGLLVYAGITLFIQPKYQSSVTMYVYNEADAVKVDTVQSDDLQAAQNLAETYTLILQSNSVLDSVMEEIGYQSMDREDIKKMVSVGRVQNSQIMQIVVTTTDPAESMMIANAFAKVAPSEIVRITKVGGVEVVDYAELAKEASSPRTLVFTFISTIVAMLALSVFFVIRSLSDMTIYIHEDIEKVSNIIVLGRVPRIDESTNNDKYWRVSRGGSIYYERKKED